MQKKHKKIIQSAPAVIEASSEAIATLDMSGHINAFNTQFKLLLNLEQTHIHTLNINDIFQTIEGSDITEHHYDSYEPAISSRLKAFLLVFIIWSFCSLSTT